MSGIKKELLVFLVVGSTTVFIDFLVYQVLISLLGSYYAAAKAISFCVGTLFAYYANRAWTFSSAPKTHNVTGFAALYAMTFAINVALNSAALKILEEFGAKVIVAFILATGASATLNFLGMKYMIFKKRPETSK